VLHITAALREDEHWIRALRAGSAGFLREPVSDDVLCEVIRTLVRQNEERQSIESQLRQSHKLEALGLLSAGIAHDFNNTLTVILGLTDMLTSQIGPDLPLGRDLAEIQDAANHAARLTRQLLAFSKEQPQRLDFIDVNAVVGDAARTFERIVGETVRLTVVLSPGTCVVRADKTHLLQVLLNLVGNARDAMPDVMARTLLSSSTTSTV
jgi:two-component system cell cycle sensor histidine kinase/response regulator CckA